MWYFFKLNDTYRVVTRSGVSPRTPWMCVVTRLADTRRCQTLIVRSKGLWRDPWICVVTRLADRRRYQTLIVSLDNNESLWSDCITSQILQKLPVNALGRGVLPVPLGFAS